jgi:hypothetical protein
MGWHSSSFHALFSSLIFSSLHSLALAPELLISPYPPKFSSAISPLLVFIIITMILNYQKEETHVINFELYGMSFGTVQMGDICCYCVRIYVHSRWCKEILEAKISYNVPK